LRASRRDRSREEKESREAGFGRKHHHILKKRKSKKNSQIERKKREESEKSNAFRVGSLL
jgi:hypothetical protein